MKPTIGRIVTYFVGDGEIAENKYLPDGPNGHREHPAIITAVWSDDCVNLRVFFDAGEIGVRNSMMRLPDLPPGTAGNRFNSGWKWPDRHAKSGSSSYENALQEEIITHMISSDALEKDIAAKGLAAPRVTLEQIKERICHTEYAVFGGVLTICIITLKNGFMVTGESACASPANFDREIGERLAREDAKRKIWALEGYQLRTRLAEMTKA